LGHFFNSGEAMKFLLTNLQTQQPLETTEWNPNTSKPTLMNHLEGKTYPQHAGAPLPKNRVPLATARKNGDPIGWLNLDTGEVGAERMSPYRGEAPL
jgi:hypothetical protein